MHVIELLTYAYDMLANPPSGTGDELQALRWEKFGRLADGIAAASSEPRWPEVEEVDELRAFCLNEQLAILNDENQAPGSLHRFFAGIFRTAWGTLTPWN
jgi:hypothetical protein